MKSVEIVAGMGVGKTTLSKILCNHLQYDLVDEEFFLENPFLRNYFKNQDCGFETQSCYLIQIYNQRKLLSDGNYIFDHSIMSNKAYAFSSITDSVELDCYKKIYDTVIKNTIIPDLRIYLRCDPKEQLKRILKRNRKFEKSITIEQLSTMNEYLDRIFIKENLVNDVEIDTTDLDFVNSETDKNMILNLVSCNL